MVKHLQFARALLSREFQSCMAHYMRYIVRSDKALPDLWARSFASAAKAEVSVADKALMQNLADITEGDNSAILAIRSLLDRSSSKNRSFFQQALNECLPYNLADCMLRSVSELCFNAMTSLRIQQHGIAVVPGDLVLHRGVSEDYSSVVPPSCFDPDIPSMPQSVLRRDSARAEPILVQNEAHAKQFTIHDVVLPIVYPLWTARSILQGRNRYRHHLKQEFFPQNAISRATYEQFFENLNFSDGFFAEFRSARACVTYRHIISQPIFFDGPHGYHWDVYHKHDGSVRRRSSHASDMGLLTTRIDENTMSLTNRNVSSRLTGIRLKSLSAMSLMEWQKQLSVADGIKDSVSFTVALQMTIPPDSCIQAALHSLFRCIW